MASSRASLGFAFVAACLALLSGGALHAVDFIRGDANGDGKVSLADVRFIANYLFGRGEPPRCLQSGDVNGDGAVDFFDMYDLLFFLTLSGDPPAAPYPDPGPAAEGGLPCESYGGGSLFGDAGAKIELLDAVVSGGEEARGFIKVAVSNSVPLAGYWGEIQVEQGAVAWTSYMRSRSLTGYLGSALTCFEGPLLKFGWLNEEHSEGAIGPGQAVPVLDIDVCLAEGTRAGQYSLNLIAGELVDRASGRSISPALSSATLTVLEDVAPHEGCAPAAGCPVTEPAPSDINGQFTLVGANGVPGSEVVVPFYIGANYEVGGYHFSVDFDEEVLRATEVEKAFKGGPAEYAFTNFFINNNNHNPGNGGVDEGFIIGGVVFSFTDADHNIPPGDHKALNFHFTINPETPATSTEVRFLDGGQCSEPHPHPPECHMGGPQLNDLTVFGTTIYPTQVNSFVFTSAVVNILPDGTFFIRGDSNGDGKVNISDPQATLNYLFVNGGPPRCFDAADANDDGKLDMSDPISTLHFLFGGGPQPPPPYPEPGDDPTADRMGCFFLAP